MEELTRALPDDVALAGKNARVLTELRRFSEALRAWQAFAARPGGSPCWAERLGVLEAMLAEKKADEARKAVDDLLKGGEALPADVKKRLEDIRRRCEP